MNQRKIIVTCLPALAPILANEIKALGFKVINVDQKSVETSGSLEDTYQLNYCLRTASKVLYQIATFTAIHPNHLYKNIKKIEWENWISEYGYFSVDSFVRNQYIRDHRFANLKVKDAIVDRFSGLFDKRPYTGSERDKVVLYLHWIDRNAAIYLDTSGETLARHGYRMATSKAPMQESLAAACILQTGWSGNAHFINPMCGSGTLAIEAALMAAGKYPGDLRHDYSLKHVKPFDKSLYSNVLPKQSPIPKQLSFRIVAGDIDKRALHSAKQNAHKAGVGHLITFVHKDFRAMDIPDGAGIVMMNPEYGERMGSEKDLESLYSDIGHFFKQKCQGKQGYVFTGNMEAAKRIGLRTTSRTIFYNGKIECRLLAYDIYAGSKKS